MSLRWEGNYSLTYTYEDSQDVGHDDNEEMDLDQDDYGC